MAMAVEVEVKRAAQARAGYRKECKTNAGKAGEIGGKAEWNESHTHTRTRTSKQTFNQSIVQNIQSAVKIKTKYNFIHSISIIQFKQTQCDVM